MGEGGRPTGERERRGKGRERTEGRRMRETRGEKGWKEGREGRRKREGGGGR